MGTHTPPLSIVTWKWGDRFQARHVNTLRSMLSRQPFDHRLICVTDDPAGLDGDIVTAPIEQFTNTPRCRRRMAQYSQDFAAIAGPRFLSLDLDVVLVGNVAPLVLREAPLVCWRVGYAQVYSGSFVLMNTGLLHGLYAAFAAEPDTFPRRVQPVGVPSDQAMLNWYLARHSHAVEELTEADGLVTYFGDGYASREHYGVGPSQPNVPAGARIVVLGSADLAVLDEGRFDWVKEFYR